MKLNPRFLEAIATLIGATIGAGVLGIPYVVAKAGFWTGMAVILSLGAATLMINLYMGEVVLRTKGRHQLSGYAEKYTGKLGKGLASAFMVFGIYGAMIAYTIGVGSAAFALLSPRLGGLPVYYSLVFFAVAAYIVCRGIRSFGKVELLITGMLMLVVIIIPLFSADRINLQNFTGFDIYRVMVPFGVVLFAFMGSPAIPEMREELGRERKKLMKAIIIGSLIPLVVYILFAAVVVGIIGGGFERLGEGERIATVALSMFVRPEIGILANIFAVLTMTTSFLALGMALSETFQYDYRMKKYVSLFITLSVPLVVFIADALLFDVTSFINILGITGSVTGGIIGLLIILMHHRAKKSGDRKPEFSIRGSVLVSALLAAVFVAGIVNELVALLA
ncbi:amino acid permease [Candidatus Woesearchaeota archaeon]|nr:amino acid permease [Candidatus Woesearchaeota archaeon]